MFFYGYPETSKIGNQTFYLLASAKRLNIGNVQYQLSPRTEACAVYLQPSMPHVACSASCSFNSDCVKLSLVTIVHSTRCLEANTDEETTMALSYLKLKSKDVISKTGLLKSNTQWGEGVGLDLGFATPTNKLDSFRIFFFVQDSDKKIVQDSEKVLKFP